MPTLLYSQASDRDIDDIWRYVAQDSEFQADRLIAKFREKLQQLARWNTMGRPRPELGKGCRSYPFGKYCFYFRTLENGIEVIRVLHSARDLDQISFPK